MAVELTLTTDTFEKEVLQSDKLVVVDFWAEWCMPCKMIAPVLVELAQDFHDTLVVGKVNVDHHGELAQQYGVVSIPTLLFFKGGTVVKQHVGAAPKQKLADIITSL